MAAVMLRRVFLQLEYKDLLAEINNATLKSCQAELLVAIQAETSPHIQRKICDAVAELARSCIGMTDCYLTVCIAGMFCRGRKFFASVCCW